MKKIKKFLILLILVSQGFILNATHANFLDNAWKSISNSFVTSEQDIHGKMLVWQWDGSFFWKNSDWWANPTIGVSIESVSIQNNFIKTIIRYLLGIVAVIAITVFIYNWFELFSAEWKQEVLKKSMKSFVYAAIGLAVIPLAFIIIKITTWFSF